MSQKQKQLPIVENSDVGILKFCLKVLYEHDCDELAERLIRRFGGVSGIFGATHEQLMGVDGVTDRVATFFSVLRPMQRQAQLRAVTGPALKGERDIASYAAVYFMNEYEPTDVMVCLDKKSQIIRTERLVAEERVREIAAIACERNAQRVVLMRFEPTLHAKSVLPTNERQKLLIKAARLLSTLGIDLMDYIEYNKSCYFSLRSSARGNIQVKHVFDGENSTLKNWTTAVSDIEAYHKLSVAHRIEQNIKQDLTE